MLTDLIYRLRAVFRRERLDSELDEELRMHLDYETEKYVRSGMSEQQARRQARVAFGGVEQAAESCRSSRGILGLTELLQDLRYGFRVLRKARAFTAVAIVSLALGIGANTVAFSVVNSLVLRPLPLPDPDRLFSVTPKGATTYSFPNYRDLRDRNDVFSGLAAYRITVLGLNTGADSQRVWGYLATGNYFEVLGAKPLLGRFFGPDEDRVRGGSMYAVLSYGCWQNRFGADPGIVGRTIRLNRRDYTVLGVAAKGFQGTEVFYWPEIWVPMSMQEQVEGFPWLDERGTFNSMVIGRLKPGISPAQAESRLKPIAAALAQEHPRWNEKLNFSLSRPGLMGEVGRGPVASFTAGVLLLAGLVLLTACANLASLLVARTADRHKELAVRISLGAGAGRLARQLLTESVMLAIGGGAAAMALSAFLLRALTQWRLPLDVPVQFNVDPDWRVFVFTGGLAILSAILFGVAPAYRASRTDCSPALKGMPAGSLRKWSVRDILLPVQVTLCCLLVMCSLVSLRGLQRALEIPLGFQPAGVAVAGMELGLSGYNKQRARAFQRAALDSVARIPGVTMAAYSNSVPISVDHSTNSVAAEAAVEFRASERIQASTYQVSPGYFQAMGTRLLSGREFSWQDDEKAPSVAIINEVLARRLFGNTDVVGRRFRFGAGNRLTQVIGVVQDGKYMNLTEEPRSALFWSAVQRYNANTILIARTSLLESETAGALRRMVHETDPNVAIHGVGSLNQLLGFAYFPARAATIALGVFGMLAIMLAATGIYGMAAYSTSRRRREIGIRMAIGAQSGQILRLVMGRTFVLLALGSVAGFLIGLGARPLLASVVYQATPHDPLVMAAVPVSMALVAFLAALGPARRALKIDPSFALRNE